LAQSKSATIAKTFPNNPIKLPKFTPPPPPPFKNNPSPNYLIPPRKQNSWTQLEHKNKEERVPKSIRSGDEVGFKANPKLEHQIKCRSISKAKNTHNQCAIFFNG
jgi:hypothetical protein